MPKKFPKTLFVKIEVEKDGATYWATGETPEDLGTLTEALTIATYQLVEVRRLRFTPLWGKK